MKVGVALGIAQGLEYMHSQSPPVAHFDIKPGNILLSDAGVPKICDFGLSQELVGQPLGCPGTPAFMAPEILEKKKRFGLPADMYSLGCVVACVAAWVTKPVAEPVSATEPLGGVVTACTRTVPAQRWDARQARTELSHL